MLVRFVVSNFLSFHEEQEFNMLAGSLKTHKHHVYKVGKVDLLKAAAIYGANGAGKSNLVKAMEFLQEIVISGGLSASVDEKKFKLGKMNPPEPVSFEIEVSVGTKIYAYGVSVNGKMVTEEWLYESGVTIEDKLVFERKVSKSGKTAIKFADKHAKTQKQRHLIEFMEKTFLKEWELLLAKDEELNIKEISLTKGAIVNSIYVIHPKSKYQRLVERLSMRPDFRQFANELLHAFDTGVAELDVESTDFVKYFGESSNLVRRSIKEEIEQNGNVPYDTGEGIVNITKKDNDYIVNKVVAKHFNNEGHPVTFDLQDESDGTQRLLDFIPAVEGILKKDVTFVIDEIDQSLHPALLKSVVEKIMRDETTKGQLIFTTHESNLLNLDIFRQDEIWFAEKDKATASTQLYSLMDFKPRYDLDIRKGYLKGRFGAIPFLAELEGLNWNPQHA